MIVQGKSVRVAKLCLLHKAGVSVMADYEIELPIGNVVPLCAPCCAWWRLEARRSGDPQIQPVSIRDHRPQMLTDTSLMIDSVYSVGGGSSGNGESGIGVTR